MRAANINHGPGSSLWHCIGGVSNIDKFRAISMSVYNTDVFIKEGLWFCDPDFCLANKIPLITFN